MPRKSSVRTLPKEIRELINSQLDSGATLTQIVSHLKSLEFDISRSAIGRYKQRIDKMGEKIRRSREAAEALAKSFGEGSEQALRVNIEFLHSLILDLNLELDENGTIAGKQLNPDMVMKLSKAVEHIAKAQRLTEETKVKIREEAKKEAQVKFKAKVEKFSAENLRDLSNEELENKLRELTEIAESQ